MVEKQTSLYFHIPFCTKKCGYCHFYVLPDKTSDKDLLMQGFWLEWQKVRPMLANYQIVSIYFGGGTPALIGPEAIEKILSWIHPPVCAEITLEANPENVDLRLMRDFKQAGINRLSLGAQVFDDDLLKVLGRTHNAAKTKKSVEEAYMAGIENLSIDLMYDIPMQTLGQWKKTLEEATLLPITHLSLYNLTFEPNTLFFKKQNLLKKSVPDPDSSLAMYLSAVNHLQSKGLIQYEISAFAKNGLSSKHNLGYWTGRPFLGLGPSAFSYWEGKRFRNIAHLGKYLKMLRSGLSPIDFEEKLDDKAAMRELFAINLRLKEGVSLKFLDEELIGILKELARQGFLEFSETSVKLTDRGVLFYDTVASEII